MAYVILSANGEEFDRRELTGPSVVGRAPDCDLPIRDILLSRRHCTFEPAGAEQPNKWVVTDLGSKNGTYVRSRPIARHVLKDGDDVRAGRTTITFKSGPFVPALADEAAAARALDARQRAADPTEALAGTVAGFILVEPGEVEHTPGAPVPQPRPQAPAAYQSEEVYGMVSDLVASSWDSLVDENSRPLARERPPPSPNATVAGPGPAPGPRAAPARRTSRRPPRVAMSLQADPPGARDDTSKTSGVDAVGIPADAPAPAATADEPDATAPVPTLHVPPPGSAVTHDVRASEPPARSVPTRPRRCHQSSPVWRHVAVAVASALLTLLLVGAWVAIIVTVPPAR